MSKLDRNDGTLLTLGTVAALAVAGTLRRRRGSQSRHRGDIMGHWNIPDEVYDYGVKHGLQGLATGGNIDYMAKPLGKEVDEGGSEVWAVLGSHEDAGSPENLDEPANINIFLDENWQRIIILPFKTTREAIEHMGTMSAQLDGPTWPLHPEAKAQTRPVWSNALGAWVGLPVKDGGDR